ncbi:MAG: outer membrane beta-barrel protein [Alphaproteobacteria bacterium]|nr:outer membrane beta-barrel protein [Alphaproteobacteria bacterium]
MRKYWLVAAMVGAVSAAQAADLPDVPVLRGGFTDGLPASRINWQGFYVGAQAGYGAADARMDSSNQTLFANLLQDLAVEQALHVSSWTFPNNDRSVHAGVYGVFGGYNSQWDDVVLGLEASYVHGKFAAVSNSELARRATTPFPSVPPLYYSASATSMAGISLSDMVTLRGRAGYAYGPFLPYLFGGLALGNADIIRAVQVDSSASTQPLGPFVSERTLTANADQRDHLVYGYTLGVGVDVQMSGNLFMRAEYEYVRFVNQMDTVINTARLGLGYRF